MKTKCAFLSVVLLAACGGLTDDDDAYYAKQDEASAKFLEVVSYDPTILAQMPTSGNATYSGNATLSLPDDTQILGDISLDAEYATKAINGKITNMISSESGAVSGSLTIDATILGTGFGGTLSGEGTSGGDTVTITSGTVDGDFRGPDAEAIYMRFDGEANSSVSGPLDFVGAGYVTK